MGVFLLGIERSAMQTVHVKRSGAAVRLTGLNLELCWGIG